MKKLINNIFKKKKDWFSKYPELRVKHAFTSGGVDYFEFEDPNALIEGRGFAALNVYKELSMSCSREFLQAHVEAMDVLLRPKQGERLNIPEMAKLNLQLKERLEMIIDSMTPYKVASVIYFDETEDPYSYDMNYAMTVKIPKWKKENVGSFFLQTPLKSLIPSTLSSEETLESYMKVGREMDKMHYQTITEAISQLSSNNPKMKELLSALNLEKNII